MAAMFSNTRTTTSSSGHIVEFKAGRSRLEPGTAEHMRKVVAESTKGLVYIKQSSDMLIHFCWKDRESGALVDDLIIFPDDAEFKAVTGCPDGKVFMLKFKSSGEMKLFWLQDSTPEVEKDLVKKVNDALNKPPTSRPSGRSGAAASSSDRQSAGGASLMASGNDFNAPLGGLDQGQLMSLIQSLQGNTSDTLPLPASSSSTAAAPSSEADCEPPTASSASTNQPLSLNNPAIQSILNNFGRQGGSQKKEVSISLGEALSTDAVAEVVRENAEELLPHLPPSDDPLRELAETVKTPQFRQAADTIGHALQTGQLGPVLSQFGMNDETVAAAANGDVRAFARNLTKAEGGPQGEGSSEQQPPKAPSENSDDDATREPEPKRNRPDLDDMDVD